MLLQSESAERQGFWRDPTIWLEGLTIWSLDDYMWATAARGKVSARRLKRFGLSFSVADEPADTKWAGVFREGDSYRSRPGCSMWQVHPTKALPASVSVDSRHDYIDAANVNAFPPQDEATYFWWCEYDPSVLRSASKALYAALRAASSDGPAADVEITPPTLNALLRTYPLPERRNVLHNLVVRSEVRVVAKGMARLEAQWK